MRKFLSQHGEWLLIALVVIPTLTYVLCVVGPEADRVAQVARK